MALHADRSELFRILSFLSTRLPHSCAIYSYVYSAIVSRKSSYMVRYAKSSVSGKYLAIVGFRKCCSSNSNHLKHCWLTIAWDDSDPEEICKMSDSQTNIDWKNDTVLSFGYNVKHDVLVLKHLERNHAEFIADEASPLAQYYIPTEEAINLLIDVPSEVYVKTLERKDAENVHETCPHNSSITLEDIEEELELFPSAGVFLKSNDQLVSWFMWHPPAGMSRLYTAESFRRKGYAILAARYLSKIVAQWGSVPFVNVMRTNTPALTLFAKLGFRLLGSRDTYLMPSSTDSTSADR